MHHPLLFTVVVLAVFLAALGYNLVCAWTGTASGSDTPPGAGPERTAAGSTPGRYSSGRYSSSQTALGQASPNHYSPDHSSPDHVADVPVALGGRVGVRR